MRTSNVWFVAIGVILVLVSIFAMTIHSNGASSVLYALGCGCIFAGIIGEVVVHIRRSAERNLHEAWDTVATNAWIDALQYGASEEQALAYAEDYADYVVFGIGHRPAFPIYF